MILEKEKGNKEDNIKQDNEFIEKLFEFYKGIEKILFKSFKLNSNFQLQFQQALEVCLSEDFKVKTNYNNKKVKI